jgi:hypothetical protein
VLDTATESAFTHLYNLRGNHLTLGRNQFIVQILMPIVLSHYSKGLGMGSHLHHACLDNYLVICFPGSVLDLISLLKVPVRSSSFSINRDWIESWK